MVRLFKGDKYYLDFFVFSLTVYENLLTMKGKNISSEFSARSLPKRQSTLTRYDAFTKLTAALCPGSRRRSLFIALSGIFPFSCSKVLRSKSSERA